MNKTELFNQIKPLIHKVTKTTKDVDLSLRLSDDLNINSLAFISLIIEIERLCDVRFKDEDIHPKKFITIEDVVTYVSNLYAAKC